MNKTKDSRFSDKIGFLIIGFDLILFLMIIILRAIRLMDGEEFNQTLVLLVPIRGLYVVNIVKYLIADNSSKVTQDVKSDFYKKTVSLLIGAHFVSLIGIIIIFGLGGEVDLFWLRNSIGLIETFFGVYLSQIIPDIFKLKNNASKM